MKTRILDLFRSLSLRRIEVCGTGSGSVLRYLYFSMLVLLSALTDFDISSSHAKLLLRSYR